jgi:tetratricopeptide (TPR) repeat protein
MKQAQGIVAGLVLGASGLVGLPARADDVDEATRKLIDLDQRVHTMVLEFKDGPSTSPDIADRRVLDAQVLFIRKNYEEAATILLDVVEKYPNTRAHEDALFLLGEALFQAKDLYSARHYLEMAVAKNTGSKPELQALQRLVELSFRTGDYENVDSYLKRLENLPAAQMEPAIPYVRGKCYYFRDRLDEAMSIFSSIPEGNPYFFQARYFIATIQVKRGDLAGASVTYDAILKQQPPDEASKDIQDLARLALGRILYERSQFDRAVEIYGSIQRQSKYFEDSLREQAWTFIKAKQWQLAFRALDLLLLNNPEAADGPDLRLLKGNLQLRLNNFWLAEETYVGVRDDFEPVSRQLQQVIIKAQTDPAYFDTLVGKSLDKFDITAFVPASAAKWVKSEPDVARMMALASDVGQIDRDLKDSEKLVSRIERAIEGAGKAGIFPDLAAARSRSTEIMNQELAIRQRMVGRIRTLLDPILTAEERRKLDVIAVERDGLQRQLANAPATESETKDLERSVKGRYAELDSQASELNVQIQALEAQLVAIENYYRSSRAEQKIRPEDIQGPVRDMREAIDELRSIHDKLREEIADAAREATVAGATGQAERASAQRLEDLLKQETAVQNGAMIRLSVGDRVQVERVSGVLSRCDAIERQLSEFDKRVDGQVDVRLGEVRKYLATEKEELASATTKLGSVIDSSKSLGGGLAQAMFTKVADKFYDLVVRSDVGVIDVAWGLKDQKTAAVTKLTNQKNLEIKALDEDFHKVLEDDK